MGLSIELIKKKRRQEGRGKEGLEGRGVAHAQGREPDSAPVL